ncbi:MAG: hypothetical protein HFE63_06760 [Clostridiales bacterium]|nr:hypothetical protein [Clostridiales bacterium]
MSDNINNTSDKQYEGLYELRGGNEAKLLSLLGLAAKARRLVAGADLVRDSIRCGKAIVTIVSGDASSNTRKRIIDACKYYSSNVCIVPIAASELGKRIGKTSDVAVIAVTDINFANGIRKLFDE